MQGKAGKREFLGCFLEGWTKGSEDCITQLCGNVSEFEGSF